MAQNKQIRIGPIALTTTLTTNILNSNVTSLAGPVGFTLNQPYLRLLKLTIVNKTGAAATFSLWLGATGGNAAGTEVIGTGTSIPANSSVEKYLYGLRMESTDFLVGGSNTATALTIEIDAEVGIAG